MKELQGIKSKKIFVGLSGGVDSAVSAALLQKAGAEVTGVFIKGWYPPGMPCTWADDRRDAMRVAAHLRIPFYTLDASVEYKKAVIDYLLAEYAEGRTPNPDIMCNREVKFGAFYAFAREHHANFIATGHYARTEYADGTIKMLRGVDPAKDQSYFLWAIPQDALAQTIFPVGTYKKDEIRNLAAQFDLPVAQKRDSQGVCFLGSISVDDFLRNELHPENGKAVDSSGKKIGTHDGAILYTLGQRIALHDAESGPWYVIKKDMRTNVLTVSHEQLTGGSNDAILLTQTNWFDRDEANNAALQAQYRYHGPLISGALSSDGSSFTPSESLGEPLASGQSLVVYRGDECVGGGIMA